MKSIFHTRLLFTLLAIVSVLSVKQSALAAGTPAGVPISNSATLDYVTTGTAFQIATNTDTVTVQELIDVIAIWQDAANIQVGSPAADNVLTFLVQNTGNGTEVFTLGINNSPAAGDDFDPTNPRIYLDGNGNNQFDDPATDPLYVPGSNDLLLDANGSDSATVFILNDIPTGIIDGQTGDSRLRVQSTTAGAPGSTTATILQGAGDAGIDAVIGNSNADAEVSGTYQVLNKPVDVAITKSAQVISDGRNCNTPPCSPVPGATIRYTLALDITGTGIADTLIVTDSIPVNTTFIPASITLDSTPLTDTVDGDEGNFSGNLVTVDLGALPAPATRVITLEVTID